MKNKNIDFLPLDFPGLTIKSELDKTIRRFKPNFKKHKSDDISLNELELLRLSCKLQGKLNVLRFGFNMPGDPVGFYGIDKDGFSFPLKSLEKSFASEDNENVYFPAIAFYVSKMNILMR